MISPIENPVLNCTVSMNNRFISIFMLICIIECCNCRFNSLFKYLILMKCYTRQMFIAFKFSTQRIKLLPALHEPIWRYKCCVLRYPRVGEVPHELPVNRDFTPAPRPCGREDYRLRNQMPWSFFLVRLACHEMWLSCPYYIYMRTRACHRQDCSHLLHI